MHKLDTIYLTFSLVFEIFRYLIDAFILILQKKKRLGIRMRTSK